MKKYREAWGSQPRRSCFPTSKNCKIAVIDVRLLIYGFGPYKQFNDNITEEILRRLPVKDGVKKVVFPVRFQKKQFIEALKKYKPEVILGLGQTSRSKRVKIERRAVNRRRESRDGQARPIISGGSKWLSATLRLKRDSQAKISYDAGDYVCNYSMYVILDYLKRHRFSTRFSFVHIPYDYSVSRARRFVLSVARKIQGAGE